MHNDAPFYIALAVLGVIIALSLFGVSRIKSRTLLERGHLIFSFMPWLHLFISYAVAFYVRLGFGSWPRSCLDSPELPMLYGLVLTLMIGFLLIIPFGVPFWLGFLVIRLRLKMSRYWILSTVLFVTGVTLMLIAQAVDPWNFWCWVWD